VHSIAVVLLAAGCASGTMQKCRAGAAGNPTALVVFHALDHARSDFRVGVRRQCTHEVVGLVNNGPVLLRQPASTRSWW